MPHKESRVRFIPLENSSLFALNRPFHAVIRNTKDPRIKKLVLLEEESAHTEQEVVNTVLSRDAFSAVKELAKRNHTSVSAVIEAIVERHLDAPAAPTPPPGAGRPDATASAARAARMAALEQGAAGRPGHGPEAPPAGPVDFIISNIVEASVLILDGLDEEQERLPEGKREETFEVIHHALKTLIRLKHGEDGGFFSEAGKERLLSLMKDLDHFRSIADEEERALEPEAKPSGARGKASGSTSHGRSHRKKP